MGWQGCTKQQIYMHSTLILSLHLTLWELHDNCKTPTCHQLQVACVRPLFMELSGIT